MDDRRIGCLGAFSGGLMAIYVSGLCDLIRVTCAAGWVTTLGRLIESGVPGSQWTHFAVPGLYNFLDLPDVACLTVPRALCLMALEKDPVFPGDRADETFDNIRKVYQMADKGDDFLSRVYRGQPRFTSRMLADALHWFERWL